jgi:hypothetical protein
MLDHLKTLSSWRLLGSTIYHLLSIRWLRFQIWLCLCVYHSSFLELTYHYTHECKGTDLEQVEYMFLKKVLLRHIGRLEAIR